MFIGKGSSLAPIVPLFFSFLFLDVRLAFVILRFTSVDVSHTLGILMFIGGGNLAPIGPPFLSSPALDVRLAYVILITCVDVSPVHGILT